MRVDVHATFVQTILDEVSRAPPTRPPFDPTVDACSAWCESHADCPRGMACVTQSGGRKSCAVAGLEAGRFGEACTGSEGERLCVKAGEACRQWLPCTEAEAEAETGGGGCSVTRSGSGTEVTLAALLALVAYTRRRVEATRLRD